MSTDLYESLARVVLIDRSLDDVLTEITLIARDAIPGAEATSITLMRGERAWTAAFAGRLALDADEMQYEKGHGPCMDAGRTGLILRTEDMRVEERWPDYAARVVPLGVLSSLSVPLPYQGATIGGLNNYSGHVAAFNDQSVALAREVAETVAVAVMNADSHAEATSRAENLRKALDSRKVIDMALGVIIARFHCSPEGAFAILSRASQNQNRKLRSLAETIVATPAQVERHLAEGAPDR
jgi:GAF domain-containing protein